MIGKGLSSLPSDNVRWPDFDWRYPAENATSLTLRTATETVVINKEEIEDSKLFRELVYADRLLDTLNERERIELLKYLMSQ